MSSSLPPSAFRVPPSSDEIRRAIAWQLCDAMPPNDDVLREIYADEVTLDSLGVDSLDKLQIGITLEEKFDGLDLRDDDYGRWHNVRDIIRTVQQQGAAR